MHASLILEIKKQKKNYRLQQASCLKLCLHLKNLRWGRFL